MKNFDKKRLLIYGLGSNFKNLFNKRIESRLKKEFCIVGLIDKNKSTEESFYREFRCYQSLPKEEYDYVCITSTLYYNEIKKELLEQSVDESKILPQEFWLEFYQSTYLPMNIIKENGVEIGGPSDVFQMIYNSGCLCDGINYDINTIWSDNSGSQYKWKDKVIGKQIIAEATDLKVINDETYDFVLSSNNLEHIANPLKAIEEFLRVLKKGKPLIILVPCKQYTFDHKREDTTFEHILKDYNRDVLEDDLTHLEEILEKHDLSLDKRAGTKEQFLERSKRNFRNRCLHHHVFSSELLKHIAEYFCLEILENTEFSNNYLLVAIKK